MIVIDSSKIYQCETVRELICALDDIAKAEKVSYKIDSVSFSDIYQVIDRNIKFVYQDQCSYGHFSFLFFEGEYRGFGGIAFVEFVQLH